MHHEPNRWKGFVLGALRATAGVIAMQYYWKAVAAATGGDPRTQDGRSGPPALDDISLVGSHHQSDESTTAAIGRIGYQAVTGQAPSDETKETLSYLVHWGISMLAGGAYGAVRGPAALPDLTGGLALGIGLWLFGDELAMPLLGLGDGPAAYPPAVHTHGFGAHIPFGLATAVTTQVLQQMTAYGPGAGRFQANEPYQGYRGGAATAQLAY
jgi:hypothetical protein